MIQQDEPNDLAEDYYSYTSSTRESWGRCSSLVLSDEESYPDYRDDDNCSEVCLQYTCMQMHIIFDLKVT